MLVLTRKKSERILIGDDVEILVIRIGPNAVRIGIHAPPEMKIDRAEIREQLQDGQAVNERIVSGSQEVDSRELSRI